MTLPARSNLKFLLILLLLLLVFVILYPDDDMHGREYKTTPAGDRTLKERNSMAGTVSFAATEGAMEPYMQWHVFLGGSGSDTARGIAVDKAGNIYIVGTSNSSWGDPLNSFSGKEDAFVAKFNACGVLQWNIFIGGSGSDSGNSIAVDSGGNIYIVGTSDSNWGRPLSPYAGGSDAFVAKLDACGTLQWNIFMGGNMTDRGEGIDLDDNGYVYILGHSSSTWGDPLKHFYYPGTFLAKLDAHGALQWNTFSTCSWTCADYGIAVGGSGNIYITGFHDADSLGVATVNKFRTNGAFQWEGWYGYTGDDSSNEGSAVDLDGSENVYVTGLSADTWGEPLRPFLGLENALVAKLNSNRALRWHTFLGGNGRHQGTGIVVDRNRNVYVTGVSDNTWGQPLSPFMGQKDTFAAMLNADGVLQWHTFLGGNADDLANGIAADNFGNIYVLGTSSSSWGEPLNPFSGGSDVFLVKLNNNFVVNENLNLAVERQKIKAFSIVRQVAQIHFSDDTAASPAVTYLLLRRQGDGDFVLFRKIAAAELQNKQFQMQDKYLDKHAAYTYRVLAYDAAGQLLGVSLERTI